jgi:1,4-dihydroxy-2-naphthoate octaprenyltransferase
MPIMPTVRGLLRISRLPFLALPVALVGVGMAASAYDGEFAWARATLAGLGLMALHVAVNALNEVHDFKSGIDHHTTRTPFSGGSGTLPAGLLSVRLALIYSLIMAGVGIAIGIGFLIDIGWPVAVIVGPGLLILFSYTGLLLRIGLGEVCAGLGLGGLPVLGVSLVQDGQLGSASWLAAAIATAMTFNLLLLNEFPDEEADRLGGRRHLLIVFGRAAAGWFYLLAAALVPMLLIISIAIGVLPWPVALALGPSVLLIPATGWIIRGAEPPVPSNVLALNIAWNLTTNGLLAISLATVA